MQKNTWEYITRLITCKNQTFGQNKANGEKLLNTREFF